ncbi:hypothetical protein BACCAP_00358 [Pseudoflavonifractor capillosus ATCC 29799]|uniref:Uncharacterized protein n=1 Tax=Pseudoflavonifractor capillosus ATCC 29799 TaxID=411467 RepID=A6NQ87_9FIRM|nr:hypothetical protein BACCAP_00358 [Pseudoflavonifractor capillosus ATCC 29799]
MRSSKSFINTLSLPIKIDSYIVAKKKRQFNRLYFIKKTDICHLNLEIFTASDENRGERRKKTGKKQKNDKGRASAP